MQEVRQSVQVSVRGPYCGPKDYRPHPKTLIGQEMLEMVKSVDVPMVDKPPTSLQPLED